MATAAQDLRVTRLTHALYRAFLPFLAFMSLPHFFLMQAARRAPLSFAHAPRRFVAGLVFGPGPGLVLGPGPGAELGPGAGPGPGSGFGGGSADAINISVRSSLASVDAISGCTSANSDGAAAAAFTDSAVLAGRRATASGARARLRTASRWSAPPLIASAISSRTFS